MIKGLPFFVLTMVIAAALFVAGAPPAFAMPTADNVGIGDYTEDPGTYVTVPVTITNVQDGPIISILFDIRYDNGVITVIGAQRGTLAYLWDSPTINSFAWGTRVSLVYDGKTANAIQNGASGSIVLLNFSVVGNPGETSIMDLTNIQLADSGYNLGTAPAKNGTFTLLVYGLAGHLTDNIGTAIEGVTVNLASANSSVIKIATTNETGYFSFTTGEIGEYYLNFTKPGFWGNETIVTVEPGEPKTLSTILWKKGDLNDNGISADAGDLAMMKDALVGMLTADWKYDLDANGISADAGDLAKMKSASVGGIELL